MRCTSQCRVRMNGLMFWEELQVSKNELLLGSSLEFEGLEKQMW